jgi:cardiolipin synthase
MEREIAWWLTMMVLSRDVLLLVVAAVILVVQGYRPFPPSLLGKATTFFEIALVFFVVFAAAYPNDRAPLFIHYLAYLVAALVVVSGFHYAFVVARRLHAS